MKQANTLFIGGSLPTDVDPAYLALRNRPDLEALRRELDALWRQYRVYADRHFVDQLMRRGQFQSRIWELRVGCALMDAGHKLTSADEGPDFTAPGGPTRMHIEAVAPLPCEAIDTALREFSGSEGAIIPDDAIVLRFTAAIAEKRRKYHQWLERGLVASADAFVIALSASNLGRRLFDAEEHLVMYPLFGLAGRVVEFSAGTGDCAHLGYSPALLRTKPGTGARIDNFVFRSFEHRWAGASAVEVSAVIFSTGNFTSGWARYDDFIVIHNPSARVPIAEGVFPFGREYGRRESEIVELHDYRR